jgi:hypothetical protein
MLVPVWLRHAATKSRMLLVGRLLAGDHGDRDHGAIGTLARLAEEGDVHATPCAR